MPSHPRVPRATPDDLPLMPRTEAIPARGGGMPARTPAPRAVLILLALTLALLVGSAVTVRADAILDRYDARFVSPDEIRVWWNANVTNITIDATSYNWTEVVDAGLVDNATAISLQAADDTLSQMWWGVTVSTGPVTTTPTGLRAEFRVNATGTTWGLDGYPIISLDDVINATFEMGGRAALLTNVIALEGHTTDLTIDPGPLAADLWPTSVSVDGLGAPAQNVLIVVLNGTGSVAPVPPRIDARAHMPTLIDLTFRANVTYHAITPEEHGVRIPQSLDIERLAAGGLRVLVENGIATWDDVAAATRRNLTEEGLSLDRVLSETFQTNASLNFSWAPGTTAPRPYVPGHLADQPPLVALLSNDTYVGLFDEDEETLMGFFNAGGRALIEMDVDLSGYDYNVTFQPPDGLFGDPLNGTRSGDAALWRGNGSVAGPLDADVWIRSKVAPSEVRNDTSILVEIDLSQVHLLRREIDFSIDARGEIRWIPITQELADATPRNIDIRMVPADLIRLMYRKGLIMVEDIEHLSDRVREGIENESSFGADLEIQFRGYDGEYDIDRMDGDPAVVFTVRARGTMSMGGFSSSDMITVPLEFDLSSKVGWRSEYRILLPEGLTVTAMKVSAGNISKRSVGLGQQVVLEIPEEVESVTVRLTLNVGLWFLIDQFCTLCSLVLVVVLVLLAFKAWCILRDRRRQRKDDEFVQKALIAVNALRRGAVPERGIPPSRPPEGAPIPEHPPPAGPPVPGPAMSPPAARNRRLFGRRRAPEPAAPPRGVPPGDQPPGPSRPTPPPEGAPSPTTTGPPPVVGRPRAEPPGPEERVEAVGPVAPRSDVDEEGGGGSESGAADDAGEDAGDGTGGTQGGDDGWGGPRGTSGDSASEDDGTEDMPGKAADEGAGEE